MVMVEMVRLVIISILEGQQMVELQAITILPFLLPFDLLLVVA